MLATLKLLDRTPGWAMGLGQKPAIKLLASILIDVVGSFPERSRSHLRVWLQRVLLTLASPSNRARLAGIATFLVPMAGDGADIGWAPVSFILIRALYGSNGAPPSPESISPCRPDLPRA